MENNKGTALDIGSRLKAARKRKGLSQRKLAGLSGVNNGTISLIEQNKISPSVASLKRLLDTVSISLGEFFDDQRGGREKHFFRAEDLPELVSGDIAFRQVGATVPERQMQILRERYRPGGDTGEAMLSHAGEEGGIILSGQIEISLGDETAALRAGDAYYFESSIPHRFRNTGEEECEIISVCTPPTF